GGGDHPCGDDRAHGAQKVAHDVQGRCADVQVLPIAAAQQPEGDAVDEEADERDREHRAAQNLDRIEEAPDGLDRDPDDNDQKRTAVREGGEHLNPVITIGPAWVGRPARDPEGDPRESESRRVCQHVPGVGDQRQRTRDQSADSLHHHEGAGEQQREQDATLVVRSYRSVMMMPLMVVTRPRVAGYMIVPHAIRTPRRPCGSASVGGGAPYRGGGPTAAAVLAKRRRRTRWASSAAMSISGT